MFTLKAFLYFFNLGVLACEWNPAFLAVNKIDGRLPQCQNTIIGNGLCHVSSSFLATLMKSKKPLKCVSHLWKIVFTYRVVDVVKLMLSEIMEILHTFIKYK